MNRNLKSEGGVLIIVLVLAILAMSLVGLVASRIQNNYHTLAQASVWQSALLATEAGADLGIAELRKTTGTLTPAWVGWTTTDSAGNPLPNAAHRLVMTNLTQAPDCGVEVSVDAPPTLIDRSGKQWYRIRSRGYTKLPGRPLVASNVNDRDLRKVFFRWDAKLGTAVNRPNTSRYIEVIAKPISYFAGMVGESLITMNNHNVTVDSFDSSNPAYSGYDDASTVGWYNPAKRRQHGDVATNGQLIQAGSAQIFGDVLTNNGTVTGAANVTGEQRTDFYRELTPVEKPGDWTTIVPTPLSVTNADTLTAGLKSAPTRYKLSTISLSGNNTLRISPGGGIPAGTNSYVEIWITGDLKTSGNGTISVDKNVFATFYVEGNINITGNGFVNNSAKAANIEILGIEPPPGQSRQVKLAGNGAFIGALYAPNFDIELTGGGSSGTFWGSIVGKTVTLLGNANFHYDEALAVDGEPTDYMVASWFEDNQ
jgi:hypothetical protein